MKSELLEVRDLKVAFTSRKASLPALQNISFALREGEVLGIVGESGCGKSLTSLSVMGLLPKGAEVTGGEIVLAGKNLCEFSAEEWCKVRGKQAAMIFQDPMTALNPLVPIGWQIAETAMVHMPVSRKEAHRLALDMMERVGLPRAEQLFREYPHQLSGGMRQRVMIAMALICTPQLLIADEPTTALDVTIQAQILSLLQVMKEETGAAMLFISHDLGVIREISDRVMVMYAGYVVEEAPVKELLNDPKHPYTVGLMKSIPDIEHKDKPLYTIPGRVPSLAERGEGCPFTSRCPHAESLCLTHVPSLTEQTANHFVRCHLYTNPGRDWEGDE
ncbi:peptide ABC transporter ATP-binding protein [Paenibacillus glucanolyticus]|uniref:Peptide ABC transporter ATP-binding protein n=1 Tax=Paenibacillus glucanolyticus TaxID=59843 RepID=A0A163MC85_9BACL|nr:ABC transporter ATP-binding protein [Paenibacillus glucanolyticus]KZS48925.1 peptide ABC transporter ATP-binding protein [Paenibacillus glucanolyticus]